MAKLYSNFGVFVLAVGLITSFNQGHCTENSIFQTKFQIPKSFGQNLTEEIDTVLNEKNSIHKAVLKEALQWSHIVYYESGKWQEIIIQVYVLLVHKRFPFNRYSTK